LASEKQPCNRVGLHHAGFSIIFGDFETLRRKDFLKIAISPSKCESWVKGVGNTERFRGDFLIGFRQRIKALMNLNDFTVLDPSVDL
jgi:hypothetical protein